MTLRRVHPLRRAPQRLGAAADGARRRRPRPRRPSAPPGASSCRPARRTGRGRARPAGGRPRGATSCEARDCGVNAPGRLAGVGERVERPRRRRSCRPRARPGRRRASQPAASGLTRSASSAGSLSAASSARVSSAPSQSHHRSHEPLAGASGGWPRPRASSSDGSSSALALDPAQHGVDEPVARAGLGQLDGLGDRGVGGDAVEEQELEEPELQRGADGRLELAVDVRGR